MAGAKRRGDGDGSIFQLPDGRWRGQLSNGFGLDGRRRLLVREAKTRQALREKLTESMRDKQRGINITPERMTVGHFLDQWITDVVANNTKPKTHRSFRDIVKLHLKPALGHILLSKLKPQQIQAFMNSKLDSVIRKGKSEKYSPKSVREYHGVLRNALKTAEHWDLIARNPAARVNPPKVERPSLRVFTREETWRFIETVKDHRLVALFTVAVSLGLRQGECLGLTWEDIDLENRVLHVRRSLGYVDGEFVYGSTKTETSVRDLGLPLACALALAEHKRRQEKERAAAEDAWVESGLVFTTTVGTPINPRNLIRDFHKLLKAGELPRIRFHDLRHSAATLLTAQGVPLRVVQEILGHSDIRMTTRYGQVLAPSMRDAADQMDEALTNPVTTVLTTVAKSVY